MRSISPAALATGTFDDALTGVDVRRRVTPGTSYRNSRSSAAHSVLLSKTCIPPIAGRCSGKAAYFRRWRELRDAMHVRRDRGTTAYVPERD